MNRAQRRKNQKKGLPIKKSFPQMPHISLPKQGQPDFSNVPLATMCQSIQLLLNELQRRGYPVYDFDHKKKYVQGIQIIQGKVFFLVAEEEVKDHEKT